MVHIPCVWATQPETPVVFLKICQHGHSLQPADGELFVEV